MPRPTQRTHSSQRRQRAQPSETPRATAQKDDDKPANDALSQPTQSQTSTTAALARGSAMNVRIILVDHFLAPPNALLDHAHLVHPRSQELEGSSSVGNPPLPSDVRAEEDGPRGHIAHLARRYGVDESLFRTRVPVIRIFGRTTFGQSVCVNVHRVYPYLYIPYLGPTDFVSDTPHRPFHPETYSQDPGHPSAGGYSSSQEYISALAFSLNKALFLQDYITARTRSKFKNKFKNKGERNGREEQVYNLFSQGEWERNEIVMPTLVASLQIVKAIPFYGYHPGYQFFVKVSLLNPSHTQKAMQLLRSGAVMSTRFKCFEGQLQYTHQFLIDYNLFGMKDIMVSDFRVRLPVKEPLADYLDENVVPETTENIPRSTTDPETQIENNTDTTNSSSQFTPHQLHQLHGLTSKSTQSPRSTALPTGTPMCSTPLGQVLLNNRNIPGRFIWPSGTGLEKTTFADIEVDIWDVDIMNTVSLHERPFAASPLNVLNLPKSIGTVNDSIGDVSVGSTIEESRHITLESSKDEGLQLVPSLAAIWDNERDRRRRYGIKDELKVGEYLRTASRFSTSQPNENIWQLGEVYNNIMSTKLNEFRNMIDYQLRLDPAEKEESERDRMAYILTTYFNYIDSRDGIDTPFQTIKSWASEQVNPSSGTPRTFNTQSQLILDTITSSLHEKTLKSQLANSNNERATLDGTPRITINQTPTLKSTQFFVKISELSQRMKHDVGSQTSDIIVNSQHIKSGVTPSQSSKKGDNTKFEISTFRPSQATPNLREFNKSNPDRKSSTQGGDPVLLSIAGRTSDMGTPKLSPIAKSAGEEPPKSTGDISFSQGTSIIKHVPMDIDILSQVIAQGLLNKSQSGQIMKRNKDTLEVIKEPSGSIEEEKDSEVHGTQTSKHSVESVKSTKMYSILSQKEDTLDSDNLGVVDVVLLSDDERKEDTEGNIANEEDTYNESDDGEEYIISSDEDYFSDVPSSIGDFMEAIEERNQKSLSNHQEETDEDAKQESETVLTMSQAIKNLITGDVDDLDIPDLTPKLKKLSRHSSAGRLNSSQESFKVHKLRMGPASLPDIPIDILDPTYIMDPETKSKLQNSNMKTTPNLDDNEYFGDEIPEALYEDALNIVEAEGDRKLHRRRSDDTLSQSSNYSILDQGRLADEDDEILSMDDDEFEEGNFDSIDEDDVEFDEISDSDLPNIPQTDGADNFDDDTGLNRRKATSMGASKSKHKRQKPPALERATSDPLQVSTTTGENAVKKRKTLGVRRRYSHKQLASEPEKSKEDVSPEISNQPSQTSSKSENKKPTNKRRKKSVGESDEQQEQETQEMETTTIKPRRRRGSKVEVIISAQKESQISSEVSTPRRRCSISVVNSGSRGSIASESDIVRDGKEESAPTQNVESQKAVYVELDEQKEIEPIRTTRITLGKGPSWKNATSHEFPSESSAAYAKPAVVEIKPYCSDLQDVPQVGTLFRQAFNYTRLQENGRDQVSVLHEDPLALRKLPFEEGELAKTFQHGARVLEDTKYIGKKVWSLPKLPPTSKVARESKLYQDTITVKMSPKKSQSDGLSQLTGPTQQNSHGFKLTNGIKESPFVKKNKGSQQADKVVLGEDECRNGVRLLSMELLPHCQKGKLPDPRWDSIRLLCYSLRQDGLDSIGPAAGLSSNGAVDGYHTGMIVVDEDGILDELKLDKLFIPGENSIKRKDLRIDESQRGKVNKMYKKYVGSRRRDITLELVRDEQTLVENFISRIRSTFDPELLVGFRIHRESWGYLVERGFHALGIDVCTELSRSISEFSKGSYSVKSNISYRKAIPSIYATEPSDEGDQQNSQQSFVFSGGKMKVDSKVGEGQPPSEGMRFRMQAQMTTSGRKFINTWRILRGELNLTSYTYENLTFHILHRRVPKVGFEQLNMMMSDSFERFKAVDYFLDRAENNILLLDTTSVVTRTCEFASVYGVDFYSALTRGSQYTVESIATRILKPENFLLFTPSKEDVANQRANDAIPLVIEPEPSFYSSPILVLDFQSLYPSIMIAYNLCFSTCLGRTTEFKPTPRGNTTEMGVVPDIYYPPDVIYALKDLIHVTPNGIVFVNRNVRDGVLGRMLTEILETRMMIKKSMKLYKNKRSLLRLMNARQMGLKLVANVTYGFCGATYSGRMPCVDVADAIVQTAKETLTNTISMIDNTPEWGCKVVYGDTDSMFVKVEGATMKRAFEVGNLIVEAVAKRNPAPVTLKFEKVYSSSFILAKKRYVGMAYETYQDYLDGRHIFDAKGIETVRRDGCPATAKLMEQSLKIFFSYKDLTLVKSYLLDQFTKLLLGKINIQDFIIAKEVTLGSYARETSLPCGAALATRRAQRDPRSEPDSRERVPYVIVHDSETSRLRDCAVDPMDLARIPRLRLNSKYYITRQIIPALRRVFTIVGGDVDSWFKFMTKPNAISSRLAIRSNMDGSKKVKNGDSNVVMTTVGHNGESETVGADTEGEIEKEAQQLFVSSQENNDGPTRPWRKVETKTNNQLVRKSGLNMMDSFIFFRKCVVCDKGIANEECKRASRRYVLLLAALNLKGKRNEDAAYNVEYEGELDVPKVESTEQQMFVCEDCFRTPQSTSSSLRYRYQRIYEKKTRLNQICTICTNGNNSTQILGSKATFLGDHCISVDCPVWFKQNDSQQELNALTSIVAMF